MTATRRRIASLLCLSALLLTGCTSKVPPEEEPPLPPIDLRDAVGEAMPPGGDIRRAGARLSGAEQRLYSLVVQKLDALTEELSFHGVDIESVDRIWNAVLADYPEFFWLTGAYQYGGWDSTSYLWLEPTYNTPADQIPEQRLQAEAVCDGILSRAEGMSEYERALFFHDFIVENTSFDSETSKNDNSTTQLSASRTAYGCLVEHLAVCSGYAKAFQWLAQRSGMECLSVFGADKEDNVGHVWNCIRLDGNFYYIDPTWDDPIPEEGDPEILSHDYFCITTQELLQTHVIDEGQDPPECTATDCDYYRMQGLYFEAYDAELVGQHIRELTDAGETMFSFKFGSPEECTRAMDDLFDEQRFFEFAEDLDSVSYGTSEDGRILRFLL